MTHRWPCRLAMSLSALCLFLLRPPDAMAVGSGPVSVPQAPRATGTAPGPRQPSAEVEYQSGLGHKEAKRFTEAAADFRRAVALRDNFPEAWNELGFALRQSGRYAEAIQAYDRSLQLRPNFAEALEYLGEAYVKMGRLDEARAILERLRPLDAGHASELEAAIRSRP